MAAPGGASERGDLLLLEHGGRLRVAVAVGGAQAPAVAQVAVSVAAERRGGRLAARGPVHEAGVAVAAAAGVARALQAAERAGQRGQPASTAAGVVAVLGVLVVVLVRGAEPRASPAVGAVAVGAGRAVPRPRGPRDPPSELHVLGPAEAEPHLEQAVGAQHRAQRHALQQQAKAMRFRQRNFGVRQGRIYTFGLPRKDVSST